MSGRSATQPPAFWGRKTSCPHSRTIVSTFSLNALSPSNPADLMKLRQLGARTFKLQCDKQGRIQIPQILMDFAQLKDTVAFIASSNFGQIMDGARWRAEFEAFNETGDSFLDVLD